MSITTALNRAIRQHPSKAENIIEIEKLLEAHYSFEDGLKWLNSPHPQLNGESALDVINAGRVGEVFQILVRLDSGAYI